MSFSFSFSGDDIEDSHASQQNIPSNPAPASASSAFPVQGKPQLPPVRHDLAHLLSSLPSKIAYSLLEVDLDGKGSIQIPRRELWDVRVQLMAEADGDGDSEETELGLGSHDVKTGIYEGGFKSWESSVDLVKVLSAENYPSSFTEGSSQIIEVSRLYIFILPANLIETHCTNNIYPSLVGMRHCITVAGAVSMGNAIDKGAGTGGIEGAQSPAFDPGRLQPHRLTARHDA